MKTNQFKLLKISSLFLFVFITTQSCMVSSLHPMYTNKDRVYKEELCGKWNDEEGAIFEITTVIDSSESVLFRDYTLSSEADPEKVQSLYQHLTTSIDSAKHISKKRNKITIDASNIGNKQSNQETEQIKLDMKKKLSNFFEKELNHPKNQYYTIKIIEKADTSYFDGRLSKLENYYFLDVIPNEDAFEKKLNSINLIGLVAPMHGFFKIQFKDDQVIASAIESDEFEKLIKEKKIRIEHISRRDRIIITDKTSNIQKFLIKFADTNLFNDPDNSLVLKPF